MTLRSKYILFIALLHLAALVMSFLIFEEEKVWFIVSEAILLMSLYFAVRFYHQLVQPVNLLSQGMEALKDQDFNVKFQPTGQIETDKLIKVYNQMADELRRERTKQQQQHFFLDKLIRTSPVGTIILDLDEQVAGANPAAEEILGIREEELKGYSLKNVPSRLAARLSALAPDQSVTISIDGVSTYRCHKAHFIDRGFSHHFITIEDLTAEKLKIEKQAYGKVIRMMAHEVNNSIGPINSILDSLLYYEPHIPGQERAVYREVIEVAQARNQRLNRFMRNFADVIRLPEPAVVRQDIRPFLRQVITLMQYQEGERRITWEEEIPGEAVPVAIDKEQIEQVLINIIKNAIEAIEVTGKITIRLSQTQLQVLDDGVGLLPGSDQSLFSPFFSTKSEGQGIGLTLSKEILLNHGFTFSLRPDQTGKTVFTIRFRDA